MHLVKFRNQAAKFLLNAPTGMVVENVGSGLGAASQCGRPRELSKERREWVLAADGEPTREEKGVEVAVVQRLTGFARGGEDSDCHFPDLAAAQKSASVFGFMPVDGMPLTDGMTVCQPG